MYEPSPMNPLATGGGAAPDWKWFFSLTMYLVGVCVPAVVLPALLVDQNRYAVIHCTMAMMVMYATNVIPVQMTAILPLMFLASDPIVQNIVAHNYFAMPILQALGAMIVVVSMESTSIYSRCAFRIVLKVGARARSLLFSLAGMSCFSAFLFDSLSGMLVLFSLCRSIVGVLKIDEIQSVQRKVLFDSATRNMPARLRKRLEDYVLCEECALPDEMEMPCDPPEPLCEVPGEKIAPDLPNPEVHLEPPVSSVSEASNTLVADVSRIVQSARSRSHCDEFSVRRVTIIQQQAEAPGYDEISQRSTKSQHHESRQHESTVKRLKKRKNRRKSRSSLDKPGDPVPSEHKRTEARSIRDGFKPVGVELEGVKLEGVKASPPSETPSKVTWERSNTTTETQALAKGTSSSLTPASERPSGGNQKGEAPKREQRTPSNVSSGVSAPRHDLASLRRELFAVAEAILTILPTHSYKSVDKGKRKVGQEISLTQSPSRKKPAPAQHCPEFLETFVKRNEVLNSIVGWSSSRYVIIQGHLMYSVVLLNVIVSMILTRSPSNNYLFHYAARTFNETRIHLGKWLMLSIPTALSAMAVAVPCLNRQFLSYFDSKPGPEAEKAIQNIIADNVEIMGKIRKQEKVPLAVFAIWLLRTTGFWSLLTGEWTLLLPIDYTVVVMLFLMPASVNTVREETASRIICKLPWGTIILAGSVSGLKAGWRVFVEWDASGLQPNSFGDILRVHFAGVSPVLVQLFLICTSSIFTEFISSVGTVSFLLPVVTELAREIHCHPMYLGVPLTLAASTTLILPTSSIAMALLYDSANIGLSQTIRTGILIKATTAVVIALTTNIVGWNHTVKINATTFHDDTY